MRRIPQPSQAGRAIVSDRPRGRGILGTASPRGGGMTDTSATWNDERVEQLKKLWAEGKSASQIAVESGGISRNAVIGKVHRLGLAGRPQAVTSANTVPAASAQEAADAAPAECMDRQPAIQDAEPGSTPSPRSAAAASAGNAASAGSQRRASGVTGRASAAPRSGKVEPVPEFEQHVTIMELREGMCRWPIGDPTSAEFRFCGARADIGVPYCNHHARIAYQPAADRRRERKAANG